MLISQNLCFVCLVECFVIFHAGHSMIGCHQGQSDVNIILAIKQIMFRPDHFDLVFVFLTHIVSEHVKHLLQPYLCDLCVLMFWIQYAPREDTPNLESRPFRRKVSETQVIKYHHCLCDGLILCVFLMYQNRNGTSWFQKHVGEVFRGRFVPHMKVSGDFAPKSWLQVFAQKWKP